MLDLVGRRRTPVALLQNRWGGRPPPGGFDSRPPPLPAKTPLRRHRTRAREPPWRLRVL